MKMKALFFALAILGYSIQAMAQAPVAAQSEVSKKQDTLPRVMVVPVVGNEQVTAALKESFDKHIRVGLASSASILDEDRTREALSKVGCNGKTCLDKENGPKLATAANYRFVLTIFVNNTDEIYELSVSLYDDATKKNNKLPAQTCELCGEAEIKTKLLAMVTDSKLLKVLNAPAPEAEKPVVVEAKPTVVTYKIQISSEPAGAKIFEGTEEIGIAPLELELEADKYQFKAVLANHEELTLPFETPAKTDGKPIVLTFKLKPIAKLEKSKEEPKVEVKKEPVVEKNEIPASAIPAPAKPAILSPYVAGTSIAGGLLLTVVGGWMLSLHGEITCSSGTRQDCPDVYDTRLPASIIFGAGMAAIGFGSATYLINHYWPQAPVLVPTKDGASVQWGFEF
jgi:hypothetical protein